MIAHLAAVVERDLPAARRWSNSETWTGPIADRVDADLARVTHLLVAVLDELRALRPEPT